MVTLPESYPWSSYAINGLGKESLLITPHPKYLNLSKTNKERQKAYRELFRCHLDTATLRVIRDTVSKGLALGNDRFKTEIENNFKRRVTPLKVGRRRQKIQL